MERQLRGVEHGRLWEKIDALQAKIEALQKERENLLQQIREVRGRPPTVKEIKVTLGYLRGKKEAIRRALPFVGQEVAALCPGRERVLLVSDLIDPVPLVEVGGVVGKRSDGILRTLRRVGVVLVMAAGRWYCQAGDAAIFWPRFGRYWQQVKTGEIDRE